MFLNLLFPQLNLSLHDLPIILEVASKPNCSTSFRSGPAHFTECQEMELFLEPFHMFLLVQKPQCPQVSKALTRMCYVSGKAAQFWVNGSFDSQPSCAGCSENLCLFKAILVTLGLGVRSVGWGGWAMVAKCRSMCFWNMWPWADPCRSEVSK